MQEKLCKACNTMLPLLEFYSNACTNDGKQSYCKCCTRKYKDQNSNSVRTTDLYVMSYSFDPSGGLLGFKVGKALDAKTRARQLSACHNFDMVVHAIFPNMGQHESEIHDKLRQYKNKLGHGNEWFQLPLEALLQTIGCVLSNACNIVC